MISDTSNEKEDLTYGEIEYIYIYEGWGVAIVDWVQFGPVLKYIGGQKKNNLLLQSIFWLFNNLPINKLIRTNELFARVPGFGAYLLSTLKSPLCVSLHSVNQ